MLSKFDFEITSPGSYASVFTVKMAFDNIKEEPAQQLKNTNVAQDFNVKSMEIPQATATQSLSSSSSPSSGGMSMNSRSKAQISRSSQLDYVDENSINGTSARQHVVSSKLNESIDADSVSSAFSKKSRKFGSIRNPFGKSRKQLVKK